MKPQQYLVYTLVALGMLGLVVLYPFEIDHFGRTIGVWYLVLFSLAAGVVAGYYLSNYFLENVKGMSERIKVRIFFMFLTCFFMPLLFSLSNRLLAWQAPQTITAEYITTEEKIVATEVDDAGEIIKEYRYILFFYWKDKIYSIRSKKRLFPDAKQGEIILIDKQRGFWGFSYFLVE